MFIVTEYAALSKLELICSLPQQNYPRERAEHTHIDLDSLLYYTGKGSNSRISKNNYTKHRKARKQKILQKGSRTLLKDQKVNNQHSFICFLTVLMNFSTETSVVFFWPSRLGQIGNFSSGIGEKTHTFWHWEWGRISTPNIGDLEPCISK